MVASSIDLDSFIELVIASSSDIQMAQIRLNNASLKRGAAFGDFLPNVSVSWQVGKQIQRVAGLDDDRMNQNTKSLTIEQPVFNGFQSVHHIQHAESAILSAAADLNDVKATVYLTAVDAYLSLYEMQQAMVFYLDNAAIADEILNIVDQRRVLNIMVNQESFGLESDALRMKSDVLSAQRYLMSAQIEFDYLLQGEAMLLIQPEFFDVEFDLDQAFEFAFKHNDRLSHLKFLSDSYRAQVAISRGRLLPSVRAIVQYQRQDHVIYLNNQHLNTVAYYLDISFSLFEQGQRLVAISSALEDYELSVQDYELASNLVYKELRQLIQSYHSSKVLLQSFQELVVVASKKVQELNHQLLLNSVDQLTYLMAKHELNLIQIEMLSIQRECLYRYHQIQVLMGQVDVRYG